MVTPVVEMSIRIDVFESNCLLLPSALLRFYVPFAAL